MKKASDVISSLQNEPRFKKLQNVRCIDKIVNAFLPTTRRFVEFGYIKNKTLFLVLSHNAGKQELDNNIKMIKEVLNRITIEECDGIEFDQIRSFVTNKPRKKETHPKRETIPFYVERSNGEFSISMFKEEKLKSLALEIKRIVGNG